MRQGLIATVLIISIGFIACKAPTPKQHVTPEVHLNKKSAEMGTPIEVEYSFTTNANFPGFRKDLTVFIHFLDPSGTIRFVDDHVPLVRTNQWMPSQKYTYTRTVFVPENISPGIYTVELGVYLPEGKGEWIELNAKKITNRSYEVGKILVQAPSASKMEFVEGWYEPESDPAENFYHWRWTKSKAILRTPNPNADSILYLRADSNQNNFSQPQKVILRLSGKVLDEFQVPGNDEFVKKYVLTRDEIGSESMVDLEINVDQTFIPSSKGNSQDSRELGLRVLNFHLTKAKENGTPE